MAAHVQERSLKIALFHTTLPEPGRKLGGVDLAVHRLANALACSGRDEVTVFSLTSCPAGSLYRHRRLFAKNSWLRTTHFGRLFVLPALLTFVPLQAFDLIHLHGDDWFYLYRRKPSFRTVYGSALLEARSATSWARKLLQYLIYPLEHMAVRLCTVPLALGPETAAIYNIQQTVRIGVDTCFFTPGLKTRNPRLLFIGTWQGRKRGKFVYDVFTREILPRFRDAELCMISDYCPSHPNVIADVFPSDEVVAQRYRESWVLVHPSTYEGFGMPYLEALASGTAVLSSPNRGAEFILENGKYGVIAEDSQFSTSLIELLGNSEKRTRLSESGRLRAQEFSWPIIAEQQRNLYLNAIG